MKPKHWCWDYYQKDPKNPPKTTCKKCSETYSNGSIDRMLKHLKTCKKMTEVERRAIIERQNPPKKPSSNQKLLTTADKSPGRPTFAPFSTLDNFVDRMDKETQKDADKLLVRVSF